VDSQAAKSQATNPKPAAKDLPNEQLPDIESLRLHQPMPVGSGKEYIEKLRSLESAWGQVYDGVQRQSNTLNELRSGFSDFKKEVQAVERMLKSRKSRKSKKSKKQ
jgi:hypothetical protein